MPTRFHPGNAIGLLQGNWRRRSWPVLFCRTVALPLLLGISVHSPAAAQTWNAFNAQFLYGTDFELGPETVKTLTLNWANGWTYGDNLVFADITRPSAGNTDIYAEWTPRLSLGKLTGADFSAGPVQDVLLAATLEVGEGIGNTLLGGGLDFAVPGFNFFQVNSYLRENPDLSGTSWQLTVAWDASFETGQLHWAFAGFFDWIGSEGNAGTPAYRKRNFLAQPQLLLDVGHLVGWPDRFHAGVEWQYWRNKYGVAGIDESVVQAMIQLTF